MIEHKTIEPETKTAIVMSRDAIDALRRVVDLIAGGEGVIQLEPASEPEPEPDPWPDAPLIVRGASMNDGSYWHFRGEDTLTDVVPVTLAPSAGEPLAQEVAR